MIESFLDWMASLPAASQYAVLMLLSAVENLFPPVPADVAVTLGAFLARRGEVSATWLGVLCWLANCVTAAGVFFFARWEGPKFLGSKLGRSLVPESAARAMHEAFERWGFVGVFVSRFLPGFRAAVLPVAGIAGLSPLEALIPAFTASGIWYALLIGFGLTLGASWEAVKHNLEHLNTALGATAAVTAVALAIVIWRATREPSA